MKKIYKANQHWPGSAFAEVDIIDKKNNVYVISRIYVSPDLRGRGYGRSVLRMVLEDADREGVVLELTVQATGGAGMQNKELRKWYRRNGFRPYPRAMADLGKGDAMQRKPQQKEPAAAK